MPSPPPPARERLTKSVKLCDEFLRSVAGEAEDGEIYGEEEDPETRGWPSAPGPTHAEEMNP